MKKALVCGAAGFIGGHMVQRLKDEGYFVVGVDIVSPRYRGDPLGGADEFHNMDLRNPDNVVDLAEMMEYDEIYQFAADMGGAGFVFTGHNDSEIMKNSAQININILDMFEETRSRIFYSSSACVYPTNVHGRTKFAEGDAYPALPDNEYGWEKLFSERLYLASQKNHRTDVRIARFHNTFGPHGAWTGGREKYPAALCRKVAEAPEGGTIEIWGDGSAMRSYLYIDETIEGIRRLMKYPKPAWHVPVNIGSDYAISVKDMAEMVIGISGKQLKVNYVSGPVGVKSRNSDNDFCRHFLNWSPKCQKEDLIVGLKQTHAWIWAQVEKKGKNG